VRSTVILVVACATGAVACGGSTPAPSAPPTSGSAATRRASDPNRALDEGECRSLGQLLAEACQSRPNERSARVEGWCGDLLRGVEDGSWITHDCLKHIKYMDSECLRSASNVHVMMDCDKSVDRAE
jgi:hypothetical protein